MCSGYELKSALTELFVSLCGSHVTNLIVFLGDTDEQEEGRADGEQRGSILLLKAVGAAQARVQNHHWLALVITRIDVERNICLGASSVLQVYIEPNQKKEN